MPNTQLHKILHPTDFSLGDKNAFAHALRIAHAAQAQLTLLHVAQNRHTTHWADFPHVRDLLTRWKITPPNPPPQTLQTLGLRVKKTLRAGDPVKQITHYLQTHPHDLIILATHQRTGLAHWLQHSKSQTIARHTNTMTLFIPRQIRGFISTETGHIHLHHILIPITHQPNPRPAIQATLTLTHHLNQQTKKTNPTNPQTHIQTLHIGNPTDAPDIPTPQQPHTTIQHTNQQGNPIEKILDTAETQNTDLITMPTQGHHGFLDALRGTTTEQILKQTKTPLLAVPTPH